MNEGIFFSFVDVVHENRSVNSNRAKSKSAKIAARSKAIKKKFGRIKWKEGRFVNYLETRYQFQNAILNWPEDIADLRSPYDFFRYYFPGRYIFR